MAQPHDKFPEGRKGIYTGLDWHVKVVPLEQSTLRDKVLCGIRNNSVLLHYSQLIVVKSS